MKKSILLFCLLPGLFFSCSDDESHPLPVADFTFAGDNVRAPAKVYFNNLSSNAESYTWEFGNGYSNSGFNTSIVYVNGGVYPVKLTATGPGGSASVIKNITIQNAPTECRIVSITVNSMPFSDASGFYFDTPDGPDVYYKILNQAGSLYLNGVAERINDVLYSDLPITFTLPIPFLITPIDVQRSVIIYDYDNSNYSDVIGGVSINPSTSFTGYPTSAVVTNGSLTFTFGLQWD